MSSRVGGTPLYVRAEAGGGEKEIVKMAMAGGVAKSGNRVRMACEYMRKLASPRGVEPLFPA